MNFKQKYTILPENLRKFSLRNLSVQLSLMVIGSSTIVLTIFGVYQVQNQSVSLEEKLNQTLKNEVVQLSTSLSSVLFNFDNQTLLNICKTALKKPEIIKIIIWDYDREYVVLEDEKALPDILQMGTKTAEHPIVFNSEKIGKLEVTVTKAYLYEKIHSMKLSSLFQVLIVNFILGIVLILVLNLRFIKPLQDLNQSSGKIAAGDLDYPVNIRRKDELGALANNLLTMRNAVKEKVQSLQYEVDRHQKTSLALERSESFLRLIIDMIPHMIFVKDKNGRFLVVNQAMADKFESTVEQITGQLHEDIAKDSVVVARMLEDDQWVIKNSQTLSLVTESQVPGEDPIWYSTKKIPFKSTNGDTGVIGITIDVSDLKQAEEQLKKTNSFIDSIINSMPSALFSLDNEFKITKWNLKAEHYYGIKAVDAISKPLVEVLPKMEPFMPKILENLQLKTPCFFPKQVTVTPKGLIHEEMTAYPLMGDDIEGVVIRVDDITEHVRMEEMVVQSEKMLSVGGLAAGMAHEINNPLAGMMQNAQVMLNRIKGEVPASIKAAEQVGVSMGQIRGFMDKRGIVRQLEAIHEAGVRASKIVQNMLSFAKKDYSGKVLQDIPQLLEQTIEVAKSDYNLKKQYDFKKIKIVREYQSDAPPVWCERSKIQQVIFNILKNSAEAMHYFQSSEDPVFFLRVKKQDEFVYVEIEDNGPGMEEDVRKRIFEPFFTTKPVDKGTGLGLSVSYFIITENHGGKMNVISEPGKGTRFIIALPV